MRDTYMKHYGHCEIAKYMYVVCHKSEMSRNYVLQISV